MRLDSLRLRNFRQHEDTALHFAPGLTGIVGPNGAGKSTILEAIAWALYGNPAARGTRETIRFARADPKARVEVELVFRLAGHRYRVVRGLTTARVWLDEGETPVAETVRATNAYLQRRLRMTRQEFFHTYFTGQKELDVMAALGPTDRARFLARVLGYDRLTVAQELVREARREADASWKAIAGSLPDEATVTQRLEAARAADAAAQGAVDEALAAAAAAAATLAETEPAFRDAETAREARRQLDERTRAAERERVALAAERTRVDAELASLAEAERDLPALDAAMAPLADATERLADLDRLAAAGSERERLGERHRAAAEALAVVDERLAKLASAPALDAEQRATVERAEERASALATEAEEARTRWARDRQEAETRLEALRTQFQELQGQQETLAGLGAESPCPTCGRPLGEQYGTVLEDVTARLDTLAADGQYFRQRAGQLKEEPEHVRALESRAKAAREERTAAERRLARIQAGVQERAELLEKRPALAERVAETERQIAALPTGYDAAAHAAAREAARERAGMEARRSRLVALVERATALRARADDLAGEAAALEQRLAALAEERTGAPMDAERFEAVKARFEAARDGARRTELAVVGARGAAATAAAERKASEDAVAERERLVARLRTLETTRAEHAELDRAFAELRTDLNAQLRPDLAALASDFLTSLTDGRYTALELDEQYAVQVLEDGMPKPVLSGGEEDLCNLVLRLAISQMIAERAGQAFSLLVLDEVFGSLDETRRGNVVELLRRLQDRFEQVVVITHIDDVREGLDRVIAVRYDAARGTARVQVEAGGQRGTPDGDDAPAATPDDHGAGVAA